jgi:hypothetical protein
MKATIRGCCGALLSPLLVRKIRRKPQRVLWAKTPCAKISGWGQKLVHCHDRRAQVTRLFLFTHEPANRDTRIKSIHAAALAEYREASCHESADRDECFPHQILLTFDGLVAPAD